MNVPKETKMKIIATLLLALVTACVSEETVEDRFGAEAVSRPPPGGPGGPGPGMCQSYCVPFEGHLCCMVCSVTPSGACSRRAVCN